MSTRLVFGKQFISTPEAYLSSHMALDPILIHTERVSPMRDKRVLGLELSRGHIWLSSKLIQYPPQC